MATELVGTESLATGLADTESVATELLGTLSSSRESTVTGTDSGGADSTSCSTFSSTSVFSISNFILSCKRK